MNTKPLTPADLAAKTNAVIDRWLAMGFTHCYRLDSGLVRPCGGISSGIVVVEDEDAELDSGLCRGWVQESILRGHVYRID